MKIKLFLLLVGLLLFFSTRACEIQGEALVCKGNVTFYSVNTNGKVAAYYRWKLPQGKTSANALPGVYWNTSGIFTIEVKVKFADSSDCTATYLVTVNNPPKANFALYVFDSCLNTNRFQFINNSTGDNGYNTMRTIKAVYGDGSTESFDNKPGGFSFIKSYAESKKFKVTFYITDQAGCKSDTNMYVTVRPGINGYLTEKISGNCGQKKLCVTLKVDSFGLTGNSYQWTMDNQNYTTKYPSTICQDFKYTDKLVYVKLVLQNKFGCKATINESYRVLADTIKTNWVIPQKVFCLYDSTEYAFYTDNPVVGESYQWLLDNQLVSPFSDFNFNPYRHGKVTGTYNLKLIITKGDCKRELKTQIVINGFKPNVLFINTFQCTEMTAVPVYSIDSTKYNSGAKIYRLWYYEDDKGAACTTWRKGNQNKTSNCNYTKNDYWSKHLYNDSGLFSAHFYVYDSVSGCSWDTTVEIVRTNCTPKFCSGLFNGKIVKCIGELFMKRNEYRGSKPDDFAIDNFSWRPFPGYLVPGDEGEDRTVYFRYRSKPIYNVTEIGDDIKLSSTMGPELIFSWPDALTVINAADNSMAMTAKHGCDKSKFIFKPKMFRITNGTSVTFYDVTNKVLLDSFYGSSTIPFDSVVYEIPKNSGKIIMVRTTRIKCTDVQYFNLYNGFKLEVNPLALCLGKPMVFAGTVLENDGISNWSVNSNLGKIWWEWNGRRMGENDFKPSIAPIKSGTVRMVLYAENQYGCKDSIVYEKYLEKAHSGIKSFFNPLTCSEGNQFFDSSFVDLQNDSIARHQWVIENTEHISNLADPVFTIAGGGKYILQHIIETKYGCLDTALAVLQVIGPEPLFNVDTFVCIPQLLTFKNRSKHCNSYIWFFNDDNQQTFTTDKDSNVHFAYTKPGIYHPFLLGSGEYISVKSGKKFQCNMIYGKKPGVEFNVAAYRSDTLRIDGPDTICKDVPANFTIQSRYPEPDSTYDWIMGDGNVLDNSSDAISYAYKKIGTYLIHASMHSSSKVMQCMAAENKKVLVVSVKADFDYDDRNTPTFKFNNLSNNAHTYFWNFGDPLSGTANFSEEKHPQHVYLESDVEKTICLTAINKFGCRDSVCKNILIQAGDLFRISNVFTPGNVDGYNDYFDILILNEDFYHLRIYNRYGACVFSSDADADIGSDKNWNGKVNNTGADCPEGTYFYEFTYSFRSSDKKNTVKGAVQLIR